MQGAEPITTPYDNPQEMQNLPPTEGEVPQYEVGNEMEAQPQDFNPIPTTYTQQAFPYQQQFSGFIETDQRMMKVYLALDEIVQRLISDPEAELFINPVNPQQYPNYQKAVQRPMDLTNVRDKLRAGHYKTIADFGADIRQIWENWFKFNDISSVACRQAASMSEKFEQLLMEKLLHPFRIQVVPTVPVHEHTPPPVGGLLKRPKKLFGTPLGDFRKMPRHIMYGGKENHQLFPLKKSDFHTNSFLAHIKTQPSKKTFYTSRFQPYGEHHPLTRIPSDFNYFYAQYVEYWTKQKEEQMEEENQNHENIDDEQWQKLVELNPGQNVETDLIGDQEI